MRFAHIVPAMLLAFSSCYQVCPTEGMSDPELCRKGHVVTFSCCTGTSFLEMNSADPIGKDIVVGNTTYHNAIQVVGRFEGDVNFKLREFEEDKDQDKIGITCYCFMAEQWSSLPMYVVESSGATDCSAAE